LSGELINQIITMFLIAGIGYFARKKKIITPEIQGGISSIVLTIVVPCVILASSNSPLEYEYISIIGILLLGGSIYYIVSIFFMGRFLKLLRIEKKKRSVLTMLTVFQNIGFIGFPVIAIFLPKMGVFFASIFCMIFNIFFFSYSAICTSGRLSLRRILGNINNIASMLMLIIYFTQFKFPTPILTTLEMVAAINGPLSMLVIGSMLANIKLKQLFSTPILYLSIFLRLAAIPTIVFFILRKLNISGITGTEFLIISGLPSASTVAMVADKEKAEPELAARGVLLSTFFFGVTLPYLAFLQSLL
jgi:predicted permease